MKPSGESGEPFPLQSSSLYLVSPWYESAGKRVFDILGAILLLILLLPLMLAVALAVKLTSQGPILFRQRRPGKNGREFTILKFRTMINGNHDAGPPMTRAADPRVTRSGRFLRRWKLDELPQLFNVLCGQMSFVGPRPLPTGHWQQPSIQKEAAYVLSVRPGITSPTTLIFRNEEELLAALSFEEVEEVYMRAIMPLKAQMDLQYLQSAGFTSDLRIISITAFRVFSRQDGDNDLIIKHHLPVLKQEEFLPLGKHAD